MTAPNPAPEIAPGLPVLSDIHLDTLQLQGLIEALDVLQELGGAKSAPIWAVVTSAVPLARKISRDIERVM
ncbi:MAG: hypothetical protein Q8K33_03455 [Cypionkella sp.]|uniref:hypothetical protein n=1 Tax=Cypionkella sp. TaxID=2811411 RepID=UPI0027308468|nr:hypothetical protein [Cypionkella sp.]MDP2047937.1 hypothetical protein [Cypionkella sp.]